MPTPISIKAQRIEARKGPQIRRPSIRDIRRNTALPDSKAAVASEDTIINYIPFITFMASKPRDSVGALRSIKTAFRREGH